MHSLSQILLLSISCSFIWYIVTRLSLKSLRRKDPCLFQRLPQHRWVVLGRFDKNNRVVLVNYLGISHINKVLSLRQLEVFELVCVSCCFEMVLLFEISIWLLIKTLFHWGQDTSCVLINIILSLRRRLAIYQLRLESAGAIVSKSWGFMRGTLFGSHLRILFFAIYRNWFRISYFLKSVSTLWFQIILDYRDYTRIDTFIIGWWVNRPLSIVATNYRLIDHLTWWHSIHAHLRCPLLLFNLSIDFRTHLIWVIDRF